MSAGDSNILALGDNETSQFCIFGPSALTSAEAEGMASSGDVVVHPDAWQFCNPSDYKYTALKRGYVKVTGVLKYIEKSGAAKKLLVANKTRVSEGGTKLCCNNATSHCVLIITSGVVCSATFIRALSRRQDR